MRNNILTKSNSMIERINILVILISSFFFFFFNRGREAKGEGYLRSKRRVIPRLRILIIFFLFFTTRISRFHYLPIVDMVARFEFGFRLAALVPRFFLEHRPVCLRALINVSKPSLIRPRHVEYSLSLGRDRRGRGRGCTSVNNYTRKRPARHIAAFPGFASNLRGLI